MHKDQEEDEEEDDLGMEREDAQTPDEKHFLLNKDSSPPIKAFDKAQTRKRKRSDEHPWVICPWILRKSNHSFYAHEFVFCRKKKKSTTGSKKKAGGKNYASLPNMMDVGPRGQGQKTQFSKSPLKRKICDIDIDSKARITLSWMAEIWRTIHPHVRLIRG